MKPITDEVARRAASRKLINHLKQEDFPETHLDALQTIVSAFNWSEKSEAEVFVFANEMHEKYLAGINSEPADG